MLQEHVRVLPPSQLKVPWPRGGGLGRGISIRGYGQAIRDTHCLRGQVMRDVKNPPNGLQYLLLKWIFQVRGPDGDLQHERPVPKLIRVGTQARRWFLSKLMQSSAQSIPIKTITSMSSFSFHLRRVNAASAASAASAGATSVTVSSIGSTSTPSAATGEGETHAVWFFLDKHNLCLPAISFHKMCLWIQRNSETGSYLASKNITL